MGEGGGSTEDDERDSVELEAKKTKEWQSSSSYTEISNSGEAVIGTQTSYLGDEYTVVAGHSADTFLSVHFHRKLAAMLVSRSGGKTATTRIGLWGVR